jgi:hypothetical protein
LPFLKYLKNIKNIKKKKNFLINFGPQHSALSMVFAYFFIMKYMIGMIYTTAMLIALFISLAGNTSANAQGEFPLLETSNVGAVEDKENSDSKMVLGVILFSFFISLFLMALVRSGGATAPPPADGI